MTWTRLAVFALLLSLVLGMSALAFAQEDNQAPLRAGVAQAPQGAPTDQPAIFRPQGTVITPPSSMVQAADQVSSAYMIFVPQGRQISSPTPDYTFAETPASLGCVYQVGPQYPGCNPATGGGQHPVGGSGAIVVVDAYDNPNAQNDVNFFSASFDLPFLHEPDGPPPHFQKIYANKGWGTLAGGLTASCGFPGPPPGNVSWGGEEDLDIEWAHAMAPNADIVLVEACSASFADMYFAEQVAGEWLDLYYGHGNITNSWYGNEYAGEQGLAAGINGADNYFYRYHYQDISYFASSGDCGWKNTNPGGYNCTGHTPGNNSYPTSSPWVVSAGGTTVNRDGTGNFISESCWIGSGGGTSNYEHWLAAPSIYFGLGPWADFQYEVYGGAPYQFPYRATPDIAFDADPNSGAYVYDSYGYGGWLIVGGTSLSSPALAGIVNNANNRLGQVSSHGYFGTYEDNLIYSALDTTAGYNSSFYDVTTGCNGIGHCAVPSYDQCTGVGTPRGFVYK